MRTRYPQASLLALLMAGLIGAATGCAPALRTVPDVGGPPDLVLFGGKVFTADPARPWAEAVSIRADRILAVGESGPLRASAGPATRLVDLGGRLVIPGINDAHDHPGGAPFGLVFRADPSPTPDPGLSDLLDSLRVAAAHAPPGTWLRAVVGPTVLGGTREIRAALDREAPDHPVLLWAWWGHGVVVNSAALRTLGIPEDAPDPLGGAYERDPSGRMTGWLQEYAGWAAVRQLYSALPDAALVADFQAYARGRLRYGVTSVQSMAGYLDPPTTMRVLAEARLPVRLRVVRWPLPDASSLRTSEWNVPDERPAPLTVVSGVKWVVEGTPIEQLALRRRPYPGQSEWHGRLNLPLDSLRAVLAGALRGGDQVLLHVAGDSTGGLLLSAMEGLAPDSVWRPLRVRFEHASGLAGPDVARARRLGVVVAQPRYDAPFRTWRSAGLPVAYGSDGVPNPFFDLMMMTTSPGDPSEALTREEAMAVFTTGSAYAEFMEGEKGALAPGMLADLAVLSQDVFVVPSAALPATTSVLTVVGGRIEHDAGVVQVGPRR
jgi:hypothetical protein